ncbi:hypothetical protein CDAR_81291 [Caerostris darwini]|uniref:Uncharacterized protein n=1 Tax=Caerostris darwini TaxID=1538125 RepID=A0AAV4MGX1_9ARAC|nr:hypothetical protein CDAR_81291 [Caerostris darwini]
MEGTCVKFDSDFFPFRNERGLGLHHQGHIKARGNARGWEVDKMHVTASGCTLQMCERGTHGDFGLKGYSLAYRAMHTCSTTVCNEHPLQAWHLRFSGSTERGTD